MNYSVIDLRGAAVADVDRLLVEKSQAVLVRKGAFLQGLIENSITATKYRLVVDAIGKANSWAESFFVNILWPRSAVAAGTFSKIRVSSQDVTCAGIGERWVDCRETVFGFACGQVKIETNAIIQR